MLFAALIGRKAWLPFGHRRIYPNFYTVFVGRPGSRRSTAIDIGLLFLKQTGYEAFSADSTSKEQLWVDMSQMDGEASVFIAHDELSEFIGRDSTLFVENLGRIYDNRPIFDARTRGGGIHRITAPTINILGATNHAKLQRTFSAEAIEGGFLSRCILVNAKETTVRIPWPTSPHPQLFNTIVDTLDTLFHTPKLGEVELTTEARTTLAHLYEVQPPPEDRRLEYYGTRRQISLLKLCIILAVIRQDPSIGMVIDQPIVIEANTILHRTELRMPMALGEFGRSKTVPQSQVLLSLIQTAGTPLSLAHIHRQVSTDFESVDALMQQLHNLEQVGKVQRITTQSGAALYLPVEDVSHKWPPELLDYTYLTEEENPDVQ